ncbi:hypothetical protein AV530_014647 [Patagioenas fasciata monilis]|uniref:Uncharacterized protein n=1 Tax=Patagioenas fasciata monilis TaxID=372326 RepID=A0A1V4KAZ9_PATFA|nr:hypothetical protein AV530_014647 [Patagioenas fasciata monilis]
MIKKHPWASAVNLDGDGHTEKPHHRPSVCFPGAALEALDEIRHPEQHREVGTPSREDLILLVRSDLVFRKMRAAAPV